MGAQLRAFVAVALSTVVVRAQSGPIADHHQHLFSPAIVALLSSATGGPAAITARDLIALLDSAGIRQAVVLSTAYLFGSPARTVEDEYAKVRAENDWTAAEAANFPDRLRAFCGFNPLKEYALQELERCSQSSGLRGGIKLHFGNSDVQLDDPAHVEQLRKVFRAANDHRMAIVVHMRASISRRRPYGAQQAHIFLDQILPAAPDIPVQIAHLAGTGPGYNDPPADSALSVIADAVARNDPRTKNLWFDVTTVADANILATTADLLARRIRQIGVRRVLYGSDAASGNNLRPREGWAAFRKLPLTADEFRTIASNVAPYLR